MEHFYHTIDRADCIKGNEKLKALHAHLLFEASGAEQNPKFRIEVFHKNDSPKIKGYTVWMVYETTMDEHQITSFIKRLTELGEFYKDV